MNVLPGTGGFVRWVGWVATAILLAGPVATAAQTDALTDSSRLTRPRSRLHRPYEAPVFIVGHLGLSGRFGTAHIRESYGGAFVLRPAEAANFLDFLYDSDTALVLQGDYQRLADHGRILSADGLLRHYLFHRDVGDTQLRPFLGLGLGASEVRASLSDGGGLERYVSLLMEAGQEWVFGGRLMFVFKTQLRRYLMSGNTFTVWSVTAGLGLPMPW